MTAPRHLTTLVLAVAVAALVLVGASAAAGTSQAQTTTPQDCGKLSANGDQVSVRVERGQIACETALAAFRTFLGSPGKQLFDLDGLNWWCQSDHGADLEAGKAFFCISPDGSNKDTAAVLVQAYSPPPRATIGKEEAWRNVRRAMTTRFPKWRRQSQQNDCYFTDPNDWRAAEGRRYFCGILLATAPRTTVYVRATVTPSQTILRPRRCVSSKPNRFGGFEKHTCRALPTTVS